jgi:thymidine phosphorylase
MKTEKASTELAALMVDTGERMGKKVIALVTDMDQPLGRFAGHSAEIIECIDVLKGKGPADLRELSCELAAWMFYLGERTESVDQGREFANELIENGKACEKFRQGIALQGGDSRVIDEPERLPAARSKVDVVAAHSGFVESVECEQLGLALAILGGGRETKESTIDYGVALEFHRRIGDRVAQGAPLVTIHYNDDARLAQAKSMIAASYHIAPDEPNFKPMLIRCTVGWQD